MTGTPPTATERVALDNAQMYARYCYLLDEAVRLEREAWDTVHDPVHAATLYEDALHMRLAALALEAQAAQAVRESR